MLREGVIKVADNLTAPQSKMVALNMPPEVLGDPIPALAECLWPWCGHLGHTAVGLVSIFDVCQPSYVDFKIVHFCASWLISASVGWLVRARN
jgi:hypothetical protein